ncbi:unnamed protein product [Dovyalis caffra]|uniref:Uncharacterized protein n=1 Tax=Dovyalis caffra TaxID=77055 RepID=A0AAV1RIY5_9ROSI|nr:unnamed protein product [Dovyalis caffra]
MIDTSKKQKNHSRSSRKRGKERKVPELVLENRSTSIESTTIKFKNSKRVNEKQKQRATIPNNYNKCDEIEKALLTFSSFNPLSLPSSFSPRPSYDVSVIVGA